MKSVEKNLENTRESGTCWNKRTNKHDALPVVGQDFSCDGANSRGKLRLELADVGSIHGVVVYLAKLRPRKVEKHQTTESLEESTGT
jgi:hypothetical protein